MSSARLAKRLTAADSAVVQQEQKDPASSCANFWEQFDHTGQSGFSETQLLVQAQFLVMNLELVRKQARPLSKLWGYSLFDGDNKQCSSVSKWLQADPAACKVILVYAYWWRPNQSKPKQKNKTKQKTPTSQHSQTFVGWHCKTKRGSVVRK